MTLDCQPFLGGGGATGLWLSIAARATIGYPVRLMRKRMPSWRSHEICSARRFRPVSTCISSRLMNRSVWLIFIQTKKSPQEAGYRKKAAVGKALRRGVLFDYINVARASLAFTRHHYGVLLPLDFQLPSLCLQNQNCQSSATLFWLTLALSRRQVLADWIVVVCTGVTATLTGKRRGVPDVLFHSVVVPSAVLFSTLPIIERKEGKSFSEIREMIV